MRSMIIGFGAAALVAAARPAAAQRTIRHVLDSESLPAMSISVAGEFVYLGPVHFGVGTAAKAEQHIFADTAGGAIRRAVVAHFEHFLPDSDRRFNYPRLEMTTLGRHEYLHQTWALRRFGLFAEPAVSELLRARSLRADSSWIVDRYVRTVDESGKHEVILFYLEASALHPDVAYGGAPAPPPPPVPPQPLLREVRERAARAFHVTDRVR